MGGFLYYYWQFVLTVRFIGEHERAKEMEGLTVFEAKTVRTGKKRRREGTGDPGDVDGYKGPWREYVDQVKVSKPTDEEKAALEIMFADRKKKDKKDEEEKIIEETCMLHGVLFYSETCSCDHLYSEAICIQSQLWFYHLYQKTTSHFFLGPSVVT